MVKLTHRLSTKSFVISQILILLVSLVFLGTLHYIVNIQHIKSNKYSLRGPVTTAPVLLTLEIINPDDNLLIFDSPYLITGKTIPKSLILISSETTDEAVLAKTDGTFLISFPLAEGPNKIIITAFNDKGNQKSETRHVYYSQEKL